MMDEQETHEAIDVLVDDIAEVMETAHRAMHEQTGTESCGHEEVDYADRASAKQTLHDLVPGYGPEVAFIVAMVLQLVFTGAGHSLMTLVDDDPDRIKDMLSGLKETESAESVMEMIKERQNRKDANYREDVINGKKIRTADLGDVSGAMNFN